MKTKFNKASRNLLIALLIGDGTISNNYSFKLSHSKEQEEYLKWKIELLKSNGIRNSGYKEYISTVGYNTGKTVGYCNLNIVPFIKVLRRVMYKDGKKIIANRKILNRLNSLGISLWYMDDGHMNIRKTKEGRIKGFYIKLSICRPKEEVNILIDYFKEVWDINFYTIHEGRKEDSYSLCCGTREGRKFLEIVTPYVEQVPSMLYKVRYNL